MDKTMIPMMKYIFEPVIQQVNRHQLITPPSHWNIFHRSDNADFYYCYGCSTVKTYASRRTYGTKAVLYDVPTDTFTCFRKKTAARLCTQTIERIQIIGKVIDIQGRFFVPCDACGIWMLRRGLDRICDKCIVSPIIIQQCHVCLSTKMLSSVQTFINGGLDGIQTTYFCRQHTFHFFQSKRIWSLFILDQAIEQAILKGQKRHVVVKRM
jgi:hypothetical protein